MKKVLVVCLAFTALVLSVNSTNAQGKIGLFDEQTVLSLYPGIQGKLDTAIQKYMADSLKPQYDYEYSELLRKDSTFKKDSIRLSPSVRQIMTKEINQHKYTIVNWQQFQNQALEQKSEELLFPYKQKVYEALQKIVTDQKYTYVFKGDVFVFPPPLADNLTIKVAQALKLQLPREWTDALRAQGLLGTATPAPAATKPAAKPGAKN